MSDEVGEPIFLNSIEKVMGSKMRNPRGPVHPNAEEHPGNEET
jgi:hypothetical protein